MHFNENFGRQQAIINDGKKRIKFFFLKAKQGECTPKIVPVQPTYIFICAENVNNFVRLCSRTNGKGITLCYTPRWYTIFTRRATIFSQPVRSSRQGLDTIVFTIQKLILNMLNKGTCYKYFKELAVDFDAQCILLKETHVWFLTRHMMAAQHAYACLNDATPTKSFAYMQGIGISWRQ